MDAVVKVCPRRDGAGHLVAAVHRLRDLGRAQNPVPDVQSSQAAAERLESRKF